LASIKIEDLPLQSYNHKLGHKIERFMIKSEALAALLTHVSIAIPPWCWTAALHPLSQDTPSPGNQTYECLASNKLCPSTVTHPAKQQAPSDGPLTRKA